MTPDELSDDSTLLDAKLWLLARVADGVRCPCCTQNAKEYVRVLNSGMARSLVWMFQAGKTNWVDVTKVCLGGSREEGKLRFWGLAEESKERRTDGGRAGLWRVTDKGEAFVRGWITVPSHVRLFANRFLGYEGRPISIEDALGAKFDLSELMTIRNGAA